MVTKERAATYHSSLMGRMLVPTAVLLGVLALAACGGSSRSQVVKVAAGPWPEGPGYVVAVAKPKSRRYVPLRQVESLIPKTLPSNPAQNCKGIGAKVWITLRSGRVLTYGPCKLPASVEHLRLALIKASRHY